jgi:glucose/arabinose dehydrogenase
MKDTMGRWLAAALALAATGCGSDDSDTTEPTSGTGGMQGAAGMQAAGGASGSSSMAGTSGGAGMMSIPGGGNDCPGTPPPAIKLTMVVDGLVGPTHVAQAPGDPTRLYVTEQRGTVRVIENGVLSPDFVLDLRDAAMGAVNATEIAAGTYGEGGLLAIVFDPEFATSKRLWLSYTTPGPAYSLAEFKLDSPNTIDPATYKQVLDYPQYGFFMGQQGTNHVGSMVAFGPDGFLYVSRGDGGGEYDRQMSGQDTSDDLCSILRIDPDTYPTPVAGNHEGHVWNYGFRNPWRFSFDRMTGDLYIGDVGQDRGSGFEEINVEPAGAPAGRNYGWRALDVLGEPGQGPCSGDCGGTVGPALAYSITETANSVIGGYVYRGSAIAGLAGRYVWADWSERMIKTFVYSGEANGQPTICDEHDTGVVVPTKVRSFGEDLAGELYVLAGGSGTMSVGMVDLAGAAVEVPGTLYRIDAM